MSWNTIKGASKLIFIPMANVSRRVEIKFDHSPKANSYSLTYDYAFITQIKNCNQNQSYCWCRLSRND